MRRLSILLLAIPAFLMGCSTPFHPPWFAAPPGQSEEFLGIVDSLSREQPVDVLLVHGMCTTYEDWATGAVQNLYQALGGNPAVVSLAPMELTPNGITLYQQTLQLKRGSIRVNAVLWSPLTRPLKHQICYDETTKSKLCSPPDDEQKYPFDRAKYNADFKDGLLDDCLSDVLVYQGASRNEINEQMQYAILVALATSGNVPQALSSELAVAGMPLDRPLFVITESLGSKIAFDALFKMLGPGPNAFAAKRTLNRMVQAFMYANQIPILELADQKLNGTSPLLVGGVGYPRDPIDAVGAAIGVNRLTGAPSLKLIAFTDPNDLLSFALSKSPHVLDKHYFVIDVAVSNDETYLGQIESPLTHSHYPFNKDVYSLVACGNPTSIKCK